jgi:Leucine-rich repeat (LRR) protein
MFQYLDDQVDMYVYSGKDRKGNPKTMPVELVGREKVLAKVAQLQHLSKIALRDSGVATCSKPGEALATAPNLEELDLQGNKLTSWTDVINIAKELRKLAALNLSRMELAETPLEGEDCRGAFPSLRTLVLNEGKLAWPYAQKLGLCMPQLAELHVRANGITTLALTGACPFQNLTTLTLEDNGIETWAEVQHLASLPALQHLGLNKNKIPSVDLVPGTFQKLISLSLNHNEISGWDSIDRLNLLPLLTDLRFQSNPVTRDVGFSLARQVTLARVERLTMLNNSSVRPRERPDSERTYLRKAHVEKVTDSLSDEEMEKRHPRYQTLLKLYGEPVLVTQSNRQK